MTRFNDTRAPVPVRGEEILPWAIEMRQVVEQINAAGSSSFGEQEGALGVLYFRLFEFFDFPAGLTDYMICRDPLDVNTDYYVAKPHNLRPSLASHGGSTFTYGSDFERTADGSEDQVIIPTFDAGDPILAIGQINTGVFTQAATPPEGLEVTWLDSNMLWSRNWAADVTS